MVEVTMSTPRTIPPSAKCITYPTRRNAACRPPYSVLSVEQSAANYDIMVLGSASILPLGSRLGDGLHGDEMLIGPARQANKAERFVE